MPKIFNPAYAHPEVRPIEDFWTEIKIIVYDGGWEAEDLDQLRRIVAPEWMHSVAMDLKTYDFLKIYRAYARIFKFILPNKKYLLDT